MSRAIIATVLAILAGVILAPLAGHAAEPASSVAGRMPRQINLAVSKSTVVDFPMEIRDVLISDPMVADAVVRTNKRLYVFGKSYGTTNITIFEASGATAGELQIVVEPDVSALQALLKRVIPSGSVTVESAHDTLILRGIVADPQEAITAADIAANFLGQPKAATGGSGGSGTSLSVNVTGATPAAQAPGMKVINLIKIKGKDQVMLRVTIAEVQREALKALGVDLQAAVSGSLAATLATANDFTNVVGSSNAALRLDSGGLRNSIVRALEQQQVLKTLAEPALTAISGEEANFVAGGEYPIPVASTQQNGVNTIGIEFKKFGVKLTFIPVVLSEGRISLKIATEVSELTNEGAIRLNTITIPALKTRQAQTTLEMSSGSTMVLAGLIKEDVRQAMSGVPGAMNIPVLGTLFRSRDFRKQQTELAIFVQPIVVQPVGATKLERPDKYMQPVSDPAAFVLGRVNRIYRPTPVPNDGSYHQQYGYIYE